MKPYAAPHEKKTGEKRPQVTHARPGLHLPRAERQAEKQAVVTQRRAIKKSARRHLKQALRSDLDDAAA